MGIIICDMLRRITTSTKITPAEDKLYLEIDNGDLIAISNIEAQWKFKNKESVLRFAIAVLAKAVDAGSHKITIEENGKTTVLTPGDTLIKVQEEKKEGDVSIGIK